MKRQHPNLRGRGFTIIEATLSTLIMGLTLAAALQTAATSSVVQYKSAERASARYFANAMLADILLLSYEDSSTPLFGRETGETLLSKTNYNDVDDFNGWTESPLQDSSGTVIPSTTGWRRTIAVVWVTPANPDVVSAAESGLKRITVTVRRNNTFVLSQSALKAKVP